MGRFKRLCVASSFCLLAFLLFQSISSAHVEAAQTNSQSIQHSKSPVAATLSYAGDIEGQPLSHGTFAKWTIAQSDIPEVLTPSLEPPPEPSIYVPTETPSATPVTTPAKTTNTTVPIPQQNSVSLERLISGVPLLMVILLVPLLVVIAALFYTLLRTEQEGERSPEEVGGEIGPAHAVRRSLRGRYGKKRHIKR